jgi:enamine deaminase RidA (YjgF/YER057c/UK114 family)
VTGTQKFTDGFGPQEQAAHVHRDVLGAVRPASTMLYVADLIGDGFLVEIEAQAVVEP